MTNRPPPPTITQPDPALVDEPGPVTWLVTALSGVALIALMIGLIVLANTEDSDPPRCPLGTMLLYDAYNQPFCIKAEPAQ